MATIVVANYNNGAYLKAAIDSALAQSVQCQVVLVDDGSTDDSLRTMLSYGDRVTVLHQENAGQAAAMNAGYCASKGELVFFLDADDVMRPETVSTVLSHRRAEASSYIWYLDKVDANGTGLGERVPGRPPAHGDLRELVLRHGPGCRVCPPTSGMAFSRSSLEQLMPLPTGFRAWADNFLMDASPLFGDVVLVDEALGLYRVHGESSSHRSRELTTENLRRVDALDRARVAYLRRFLESSDDPHQWDKWRQLCVTTLLARSERRPVPALVRLYRGAARAGGSPIKRSAMLALMLGMRVLPLGLARRLGGTVLRLHWM